MKKKNHLSTQGLLNFDKLVAYTAGLLSTSEAKEVEAMLALSENCKEVVEDLLFFIENSEIERHELLEKINQIDKSWMDALGRYYSESEEISTGALNPTPILEKIKNDSRIQPHYSKMVDIINRSQVSKVSIQGERGCFHEIVTHKFFKEDVIPEYCKDFHQVCKKLEKGKVDYAVMAIENSAAGSILENYNILRKKDITIIGEVSLHIDHNLMALPGQELSDIKEVHSHPMAILQCKKFFQRIHPNVRFVERDDTAGSARWIRETRTTNVAAIASNLAAKCYDLDIIAPSIQTTKINFTRFLILTDEDRARAYPRRKNKASICFTIKDKIGSLGNILQVFTFHEINLVKIQSTPIIGEKGSYFFYIDLEFVENNYDMYKHSLMAISKLTKNLLILGEYEKGETINTDDKSFDSRNYYQGIITPGTL